MNRAEAIEKLEGKAAEIQQKLAALGYAPFLFMVNLEELEQDVAGCFYVGSETIAVSEAFYAHDPEFCLNTVVPHEMCHLYVSKYFTDVTDEHGKEFSMLMEALGLKPNAFCHAI
ncbi:MAG TPA: SprT-like domain-containing protein [Methanosarcina sp.]|nr:SprT-like domain-containing protein [Methanosarcina sp.]